MNYGIRFAHFDGFTYATAVAFEESVTRRDPSPVIQIYAMVQR